MKNFIAPAVSSFGVFCLTVLLSFAAAAADWNTEVKVAADATETIDLSDATRNTRNYYFTLAKGATLKVTNTSAANAYMRFSVAVDGTAGGAAYLDLTDVPGVQYTGNIRASGEGVSLVVKGVQSLTFGSTTAQTYSSNSRDHAIYEGTLTFETAGGAGLQFVNCFGLKNLPTCAYSIAEGAELGVCKNHALGEDAVDIDLSDYNMLDVVPNGLVDGTAVTVGAGRHFKIRSSSISGWSWGGVANGTTEVDVVLNGTVESPAYISTVNTQPGYTLKGSVSGWGNIYWTSAADADLTLDGTLSFVGRVLFYNGNTKNVSAAKLYTTHTSFGDPSNEVYMNYGKTEIAFRVPGYGTAPTTATIGTLTSKVAAYAGTGNKLVVYGHQTVTIGTLSGPFRVECPDGVTDAKVVVNNLSATADLTVGAGVELVVGTANAGHQIHFEGDTVCFSGPATGERVALSDYNWSAPDATKFVAGGKLDLGMLADCFSSLAIAADADVKISSALDFPIVNNGGKLALTDDAWQKKCYMWADATKSGTIDKLVDLYPELAENETSPYYRKNEAKPYLLNWNDRRPDQKAYKFRNRRFDGVKNWVSSIAGVVPFVDSGFLNGKDVVRLYDGNRTMALVDRSTGATVDIPTKLAIMVYGSHYNNGGNGGGGCAMLGNADAVFQREEGLTSASKLQPGDKPFTAAAFSGYLNGDTVSDFSDKTAVKMNGDWQLVSLNAVLNEVTQTVQGIGFTKGGDSTTPTGRGGQSYAEILLFSEMPTDAERMRIEKYLADKWGLTIAHSGAAATGMATGITGSGEITVESDNVLPALSQSYRGALKFVNSLTEETIADLTVGNDGTDVTVAGFSYDAEKEAYVIDVALADKRIAAGDYALLAGFPADTKFELGTVDNPHNQIYSLKFADGAAVLTITKPGMAIIFK